MSGAFDDANSSCADEQYQRQISLEENENTSLQRYSRSKLYALRNKVRSQRRPDCALRSELQTLSFWKFSFTAGSGPDSANSTGMGNSVNDMPNNTSSAGGIIVGSPFSSSSRGRERQINLRDRQMGYSRGVRSGVEASFTHANTISQKASYLDQRSNSIAHLMPAFAKKRIAAAAAAQNQNHSASNQAALEFPESRDNEKSRNVNYEGSCRPVRGKEHAYEQQKRGIADSVEYISPQKRSLNDHERDSSGGGVNTRHSISLHERRIGSGRLLQRDVNWDYHDKNSLGSQQRHSSRFTDRNSTAGGPSGYHEKGSFDRKISGSSTGHENLNSNSHTANRRFNSDEHVRPQRHGFKGRNDEPEWFSGGPTSQNDIIELRGFDEPIEDNEIDQISHSYDRTRRSSAEDGSNADLSQSGSNYEIIVCGQNTNSEGQSGTGEISIEAVSDDTSEEKKEKPEIIRKDQIQQKPDMSKEFNFDAFFNLDSIDSEMMNPATAEVQKDVKSGKSRFSRWFTNSNSLEEALDERTLDVVKDTQKATNVLEFFQNAKAAGPQKLEMPSVGELEAKMRKVDIQEKSLDVETINIEDHLIANSENTQKKHTASQDMEAFKKILQQLNNGSVKREVLEHEPIPHRLSPQQPAFGMFPHVSMLPPEISQMLPTIMTIQPGTTLPTNSDELLHPTQTQQHRFPPMSPSQQTEMNPNAKSTYINDTLVDQQKRRDFVNLLHAVTRGQIPLAFLEKELNNPNIPIPTKEVITAVIRETTRSLTPSLNIFNNHGQLTPVQIMRGSPIHQQGMHSPLPMTVIPPSQIALSSNQILTPTTEQMPQAGPPIGISNLQDTHIRAQAIMQNVIMKKKIEEQQQDVNRRQNEFQKQQTENSQVQIEQHSPQHEVHSPNSMSGLAGQQTRHLNSPTPLAFTPTSVLRKMTAEKDNGSSQIQQSQQQHKLLPQMQSKPINHGIFLQNQQQLPSCIPQPRMILGGNHTSSQMATVQQPSHAQHLSQPISPQTLPPLPLNLQQQQRVPLNEAKWQLNMISQGGMNLNKPMGRPILKGPPPPMAMPIPQQTQPPMQVLGHIQSTSQQNPQVPSIMFPAKLDMPQQKLKNNQTPQHVVNAQPQPQGFGSAQHMQQPVPQNVLHIQHQQLFQLHHMSLQQQQHMQLQRQIHQQMHSQPTAQSQQQHESTNRSVNFSQSQSTLTNSNNNINSTISSREGGLSPTSNQLAQWFSPELLAQASAGKLPQINMNQALSLEEFERNIQQHSSTVVHN